MTPELKPCPFCGRPAEADVDGELCICTENDAEGCPGTAAYFNIAAWNRRTPDLTEAQARLKALENVMRGMRSTPRRIDVWADEIADIRGKLGASSASEPTPAPEP